MTRRQAVQDLPQNAAQRRLEFVLGLVLERVQDVDRAQVLGARRFSTSTKARQLLMALLLDGLGMTSVEVGELIKRDHATVSHAARKMRGTDLYEQLLPQVRAAFPADGEVIHRNAQVVSAVIQNNPQASGPTPVSESSYQSDS